jgi:hypothetical protein
MRPIESSGETATILSFGSPKTVPQRKNCSLLHSGKARILLFCPEGLLLLLGVPGSRVKALYSPGLWSSQWRISIFPQKGIQVTLKKGNPKTELPHSFL